MKLSWFSYGWHACTTFWCVYDFLSDSQPKHTFVKEAVKNGAAEYYLDSNNERQWRWTPKEKKE